jgi:hypothetical protein
VWRGERPRWLGRGFGGGSGGVDGVDEDVGNERCDGVGRGKVEGGVGGVEVGGDIEALAAD